MIIEIKGEITDKTYLDYLVAYSNCGNELINLLIDSEGGLVSAGEKIAQHISYNQDKFNSVKNSGVVASIASTIFLALPYEKRFFDMSKGSALIHFPMLPLEGYFNSDELAQFSKEGKDIQDRLAKNISKATGADLALITAIMEHNDFMTAEQMKAIKFAQLEGVDNPSNISVHAIAKYDYNLKQNEMKEQEVEELIQKKESWFINLIKKVTGFKAVMVTDATGKQIEFPDVAEGVKPAIGDKSSDESLNGEVVMAEGDTYVFENGVLKEIKPKAEPEQSEGEGEQMITIAQANEMVNVAVAKAIEKAKSEMKSSFVATLQEKEDERQKASTESRISGFKNKLK